jgi:hypothetical protein
MKNKFSMSWDENALAAAFGVSTEDIKEYLTDGRRVSFIIERRLKSEHAGWKLAPSEGAGYDLIDPKGGKWEVRAVSKGGTYFNPSSQVGKGRKFDEHGFQKKLDGIKGYILSDIVNFPNVDVYVVPVENIRRWHAAGLLGKSTKVRRAKFLNLLVPDIQHTP